MPKRKSLLNCSSRRRSRSLGAIMPCTLYERIPKELPKDERLEMLIKFAFEYSLSTLSREFSSTEDFDILKFKENGRNLLSDIQTTIKEKNLYTLATTEETSAVLPYSSFLESDSCNDHIKKLEDESKQWEKIILHHRKELENVVNKDSVYSPIEYEDEENLNYSSILSDTFSAYKGLRQQIDRLKRVKKKVNGCLKLSEEFVEELNLGGERYCLNDLNETPRTTLKTYMSSDLQNLSIAE